jgi:hypothetical protein
MQAQGRALPIDLASITDAQDAHHNAMVLDVADDPPIADAVLSIVAELLPGQCFAKVSRIV